MRNDFLTIKQASEKYKVSSSTLTRFARQNSKTNFVRKEKGKFLISDSLLKTNFEKMESKEVGAHTPVSKSEPKTENSNELVTILKTQNEFLQSQIVKKDSQIDKLLERQFEQNTIIQTLQNRIENLSSRIDNGVKLLSEKVSEKKEVGAAPVNTDNGFTIASSVLIILVVILIIVFLTVK